MNSLLLILVLAANDPWQPYENNGKGKGKGGGYSPVPELTVAGPVILSVSFIIYILNRRKK